MSSQNELEQINYKQIRLLNNDIAEDFVSSSNGRVKDEVGPKDEVDEVDEVGSKDEDEYEVDEGFKDEDAKEDEDKNEDNLKEGLKNKTKSKPKKTEDSGLSNFNKLIDPNVKGPDNSLLKEGFHIIIVILLTTTMFKNTIHKATGGVEFTSFDKMIILPIFNNIKEQIKTLTALVSTARELSSFGKNAFMGGDASDIFDIANWSANTKISAALVSYFPLLWLSQFFLIKFSEIINWISGVKWKEIFEMLAYGKGFNDRLFPDMGLYNKPKNPLLITIFSLYFVYLAGKVFFDYLEFWIKIPIFFVLFLCVWFGAFLFPFLNVSAFIFFIVLAAYTLMMPLRFYYDGVKFFPHSFMDTLNQQNDLTDWMKKFIDATYKVFIFISTILFFYKLSGLSSTKLKMFYTTLSGVVFLLWSTSLWNEYFPDPNTKMSTDHVKSSAEPVKAEPVKSEPVKSSAEPVKYNT
jgi:hypothetical protein